MIMDKNMSWPALAGLLVLSLMSIANEMDYQDAVDQHEINCASATYVNDNDIECGE